MSDHERTLVVRDPEQLWSAPTRRQFIRVLGLGGAVVMLPSVFSACSDDGITGPSGPVAFNLSSDTGILNYAYALEQLEAAFYTAVVASSAFGSMTAEQKEVMLDLRAHEVAHREFLRAALGSNAIGALSLDNAAVNSTLTSVAVILKNAEAFEDLGVSAYNGAGKYLQDAGNLLLAGKIVSVEARHAAAIRDLREGLGLAGTPPNTRFAGDDVVNSMGLDVKLEPASVLARVGATGLVTTAISIGNPPTVTPATADAPPPATP